MPITKWQYNNNGDRSEIIETIKQVDREGGFVIDIGGAKASLGNAVKVDLVYDQNEPEFPQQYWIQGNLNSFDRDAVDDIDSYARYYFAEKVPNHRPVFDYAVCAHTLEDLDWPSPLLARLPHVALKGYIAVPSIYFELMQVHGTLGFIHHQTLWEVQDGVLVGWWKIPFLLADEMKDKVDQKAREGYERGDRELEIWFEGDLPFRVEPLGPSMEAVKEKYHKLIERI
jgi:hypothetical protein